MHRLLPVLPLLLAASLSAATITSVHPSRGFYYGGEIVGIDGDDLVGAGCEYRCTGVSVFFGDAPAEVLSANNWGIVVRTPAHRVGTADITIRGPHGSGSGQSAAFTFMPSYRFLLFPAVYDRIHGAAGTEWHTDLRLVNRSIDWVPMSPLDLRPLTAFVNPHSGYPSAPGGGLLFLGTLDGPVSMTSRLQETSRGGDEVDVELPIVDARGLFVDQLWLREVPIDSRARVALRIYQVNQLYYGNDVARQDYRVRIYTAAVARSEPLVDAIVPVLSPPAFASRFQWAAAHETLDLAGAYPQLAAAGHVNILIEPFDRPAAGSGQMPLFWAFATITNNQSQHVSLVTPK
jgi:hypothetical protein